LPVEGHTVQDADIVIGVTPDNVTVTGKGKIDGLPADVSISQPIAMGDAPAGPGAQYARFVLDEAARKRLGMGLDEVLGGSVGATLSNLENGSKGQHYDLDLQHARLTMPGLGWSKGIGVPAKVSFDLKPAVGGYAADNITLTGAGFGLSGSARLDGNYGLISANVDQFALRPGDAASFTLARTKTGYSIVARGASFDLRGFLTYIREGAKSAGSSPDLSIDARFDRVVGFNQEVIGGARLNVVSANGHAQKISFAGSIGDAPIALDYRDQKDGATLSASVGDAGRLFRFADIYSHIAGGKISASAQRVGATGPLAGTFEVDDFNVVDEPGLKNLVAVRSGTSASGAPIDVSSVHFDRFLAKFRKNGEVLAVDDAVLRGAVVGATFNGRFDFGTSRMQINGTYLPAYAFNNSFSRIPLIGLVLTGGASEGIFGVTFRVDGSLDQPQVFFNPLSAVAPGIFRKIFEFH
jgi:hypothetical protein